LCYSLSPPRHLDGQLVYRIEAEALNATGAIIPEEPMYVLYT
jgi:hypothetical protein